MTSNGIFVVGIILAVIGLLLLTSKVMTYIKCTMPINATVVKLKKRIYPLPWRRAYLVSPGCGV